MNISPNDVIVLSDYLTIKENGKESSYKIIETRIIDSSDSKIIIHKLDSNDIYLMIHEVGEQKDYLVIWDFPEFTTGNREDILNTNFQVLFEEEDVEVLTNLSYTDVQLDNDTFSKTIEIFGEDQENYLTQVVRWRCSNVEESDLVVIETGGDSRGGLIEFFQGYVIPEHDIQILKGKNT